MKWTGAGKGPRVGHCPNFNILSPKPTIVGIVPALLFTKTFIVLCWLKISRARHKIKILNLPTFFKKKSIIAHMLEFETSWTSKVWPRTSIKRIAVSTTPAPKILGP